jgi:hypothetical protein
MKHFLLAGFVLLNPLTARSEFTDLSVITSKGYFSYSVGDDWSLVSMQTKPPKTTAVFEVPNPADKAARETARFSLMTFEVDSPVAMAGFKKLLVRARAEGKQKTRYKQWELYSRDGEKGRVDYSIREACKQISGVCVMARITWPRSRSSRESLDLQMENLFRSALDSVTGDIGSLPPRNDQTAFRKL